MPAVEVAPNTFISYERSGTSTGPSVVLVHGITESRRSWDPLVPALAERFDVIAVDLRGHGASSSTAPFDAGGFAGDLVTVIDRLGLDRPLLVGHSLGGVVVSIAATMTPVAGVANVDQPLLLSGFQAALLPAAGLIRGSRAEFEGFMAAMFASMDGPLPAAERARLTEHGRADQEVVVGIWSGVLEAPAAELDALVDGIVGALAVPYLAIHGIDPGPEYVAWLTARCRTATVEIWADHGHYPHLVDPARFLARLTEFATAVESTSIRPPY